MQLCIALVWFGAGVDEDAEVVGSILAQDEVVVGAAIGFEQAKARPFKVDPVFTQD